MNSLEKCPNAINCPVLLTEGFVETERKELYRTGYCCNDQSEGYIKCKRFLTKKALAFCPEFVLPDSVMSLDEIMEKLEE